MPPKPKENTVKGFCAKTKTPPKGVGGGIVQSIELKRNVSQSRRGNKVFERAIEERQTSPGLTTTRVGTKVYYFDNADSAFNAKMESINKELSCKCDEMDQLDASLAENELRMAKLDAELEKLDIIGDDAIEEAIITESEDLDLLLVPSIQNLIFKIYCESGITIPSDSDTCPKKGPSKDELKDICKQFCKDEFEKLEREKNNKNLQNRQCETQQARVDSPCVDLSTASEVSDPENCGNRDNRQNSPSAQNRQRAAPENRPQSQPPAVQVCSSETDSGLAACMKDCDRQFGPPSPQPRVRRQPPQSCQRQPSPPAQQACGRSEPQQRSRAPPTLEQCLEDCNRNIGNNAPKNRPQAPVNMPPSPSCQPAPQNRQQQKARPPATLQQCLDDCNRNNGQNRRSQSPACQSPPHNRQQPPHAGPRPQSHPRPTPRQQPPAGSGNINGQDKALADCMQDCDHKYGNKPPSPQPRLSQPSSPPACRPQSQPCGEDAAADAALAACLAECERKFGNEPATQCNVPPIAQCNIPPQPQPPPPSPPPPAAAQNRPRSSACRPTPSPLEKCTKDCENKFSNGAKRISPRPPLFSQILNGKRCFPDISEIPQKDRTLYMAERDAYVLFRRQFADRGNECTFFELPDEFEEFFYNYINGTSKINVPMCPPKPIPPPKPPQKKSSEEIIQSFVDLQKIEMDAALQRNVVDLALDRPDRDPEVIALLMNERLPLWIDPLVMSELAIPYPLHKRLFATDVRHTAPGSMVPRTIPVQALNLMNTHVLEGVEAIIKSNEYVYPKDDIATKEIEEVAVVKPEKEENAEEEEPPENYRCIIELHPFRVETFFQLRGANVPLWYPGMFTAFPDGRSSIKLVSTPSALINTAWRMCAP